MGAQYKWDPAKETQGRIAKEKFFDLTEAEKVEMHNRYCNVCNLPDDLIYSMDSFFDDVCCMNPFDAFRLGIMAGLFCFQDKWVTYDGNGNIKSNDRPSAAGWIFADDIIDWVIDHGEQDKDPAEWFDGIRADEY